MTNNLITGIISKKLLPVFFFVFFACNAFSQKNLIVHLIPVIPQSNYVNPAFKPEPKIYVGFPCLSSIYFKYANNGFKYKELYTALSDTLKMTELIDNMNNTNYLSLAFKEEILTFGFKVKKNFFSFNITENMDFRFDFPKDLLSFAWKGNGHFVGRTADFSGIGLDVTSYTEYALGYTRDIGDKFVVGGRFKYLMGQMNVSTMRNTMKIKIDEIDYKHTIQSDFLINCALPEDFYNDLDTNENNDDSTDFDIKKFILNSQNSGFGFDLGGYFKCNDMFSFGASVIDIGRINWKSGARNFSSSAVDFVFEGIDINQFFNQDDSLANDNINNLLDSLKNVFKIEKTENSYKTSLTPKIYLTGIYSLTPHDKVGVLIGNETFNRRIHPSLTISYNKKFFNVLSASVSYSIMNRSVTNFGAGFALNMGPFQMYVLADNVYGLIQPLKTRVFDLNFGFNLIFAYKEKKGVKTIHN